MSAAHGSVVPGLAGRAVLRRGSGLFARVLAFCTCVGAIWIPEVAHYRVSSVPPSAADVAALRVEPADDVLREISSQSLTAADIPSTTPGIVARAEGVLKGVILVSSSPPIPINPVFDIRDFSTDTSMNQLRKASLLNVDYLLRGYEASGRDDMFASARDYLLRFSVEERGLWLPQGLIWNDHAVASRASVLARFWRLYRSRPDYDEATAEEVLRLVMRTGRMLAEPSHFTFATNHGVMQNVALLQLAAAFPAVSEASVWRETAMKRLQDQMAFYVNAEGVVLEHSAGYHAFGLSLQSMAIRLAEMNGVPVPAGWMEKRRLSEAFLAELRRPDDSLPTFGDTDFSVKVDAREFGSMLAPRHTASLFAGAGYSIWWHGLEQWPATEYLTQTVVLWSAYPGHGHKLADEMSVLVWAKGIAWVTNTGYWPYDEMKFMASGWNGSNAPHFAGESATSARETRLKAFGGSEEARFIGLERIDAAGRRVSRQVLALDGIRWLILDEADDPRNSGIEVTWTFPPAARMQRVSDGKYLVEDESSGKALLVHSAGPDRLESLEYRGSSEPFAGWVVQDSRPFPAPALVLRRPGRASWLLTTFQAFEGKPALLPNAPSIGRLESSERWSVDLPSGSGDGDIRVARTDNEVLISGPGPRMLKLSLQPGDSVATDRERILQAFEVSRDRYPRYRELFFYRLRATKAVVGLFLGQEVLLALLGRLSKGWARFLRLLSIPAWLLLAIWLSTFYLQ